jgi:hypothetical protein
LIVTLGFKATSAVSHIPLKISVMKNTSAVLSRMSLQLVRTGSSAFKVFSGKNPKHLLWPIFCF